MIKQYYILTKPGIIYGNAIAAIAGFFFASKGQFNPLLFIAMLLGLSLIIGSACVFNNFLDQDIDKKMARTKKRPLITGTISPRNALIFGTILGLLGSFILWHWVNVLTLAVAVTGFFFYVVVYTFGKKITEFGTELGSISGAVPPVVGFVAVTNNLDLQSLLLFLVLVFWQMPHFYGIALYRLKDYKAAKVPVLPLKQGLWQTKRMIMLYIVAFILTASSLTFFGFTGVLYLIATVMLGFLWFFKALDGLTDADETIWGKKVFLFSLVVLLGWSLMLSADAFLPKEVYNLIMVLPFHILIALISIIYTAFVYLNPSKSKLNLAYTLVVLTIVTGSYLTWSLHTHLVQACVTGLIYLAVVSTGILLARNKLAHQS